jgi:elongation factor G
MESLRTFGIVAHVDAGKTTLTERILVDCGAQAWVGSVDDGTAATDWLPEERARGISITSAATRASWGGHELQIVDTPGHVDFVAEVERCLHVLDAVVVVVDAVKGVESQTHAAWQQAAARRLPRAVFVNKLDRPGADFAGVVARIVRDFECVVVPCTIPLLGKSGSCEGLGDAITGAVQWFHGQPEQGTLEGIRERLRAARDRVLEVAADLDARVMADFVAGRAVEPATLRSVVRSAFVRSDVVPVFAGAALWNHGVDWLLDGIVSLFPGVRDRLGSGLWSIAGAGDRDAPFCGLVFKIQHQDGVWNFLRVVRGTLRTGDRFCAFRQPDAESVAGELWIMQADRHRVVEVVGPGEIVVVPGDIGLRTGDTVCDPGHPVSLPAPRFPAPVLATSVEPVQAADLPALWAAARDLAADDPTLRVERESGRVNLRGMGELHLEIAVDRLRRAARAPFSVSRPRVERRETVRLPGRGDVELRAQVGGVERASRCDVVVRPLAPSSANSIAFDDGLAHLGPVLLGVLEALLATGPRGVPMVGVELRVVAAVGDERGVVEPLLQQAAVQAVGDALEAGGRQVLLLLVDLEVSCPEDSTQAVLADLSARGVVVSGVAAGQLGARIVGRAPLESMLGYVTRLRSVTRGLGQVAMRPVGFLPAPPGVRLDQA